MPIERSAALRLSPLAAIESLPLVTLGWSNPMLMTLLSKPTQLLCTCN